MALVLNVWDSESDHLIALFPMVVDTILILLEHYFIITYGAVPFIFQLSRSETHFL